MIIGILATLTTATFSGSRQKADEAKVLAERSNACKEALADCIEQQNGNCQSFDLCVNPKFTMTTNGVDPNFEDYSGTWFNSGELTQYGTVVYTNGIAGAVAYISPTEFPIDPINYEWAPSSTLFFNTFEDAKAYDAFAADYNFTTITVGDEIEIVKFEDYVLITVGFMNILP